ncbi:MAG: C1 family peptidase [Bacteroidales bacterium]|nr:C1 family peptidase [Bacteroidales bacterium]
MKKFIYSLLAAGMLPLAVQAQEETAPADSGFVFTDVTVIKTTPVRDQNKSGTCWCFSTTSFFEEELLRKTGKEYDLSDMFTVWHCYNDKARRYVRLYGECNLAAGGSVLDVPYVWANYGVVPQSAYSGLQYGEDNHIHAELDNGLKAYLDQVVRKPNKRLSTAWPQAVEGILNAYLGELPATFEYEGKTYTPQSFAASLPIDFNDYIGLTSWTHHPFYQEFILEIPDNWLNGTYYNIPMEEMKAVVDNAIDNGYPVAWAADVSEDGFNWYEGYAVMPVPRKETDLEGTELSRWVNLKKADRAAELNKINGPCEEITVTQESRQEMFDRQETTDDHGMVIVGRAVDQKGNKYYKVQNSWTEYQKYGGFFYVSEPYFLAKTMDIYVNKEALPASLKAKL